MFSQSIKATIGTAIVISSLCVTSSQVFACDDKLPISTKPNDSVVGENGIPKDKAIAGSQISLNGGKAIVGEDEI